MPQTLLYVCIKTKSCFSGTSTPAIERMQAILSPGTSHDHLSPMQGKYEHHCTLHKMLIQHSYSPNLNLASHPLEIFLDQCLKMQRWAIFKGYDSDYWTLLLMLDLLPLMYMYRISTTSYSLSKLSSSLQTILLKCISFSTAGKRLSSSSKLNQIHASNNNFYLGRISRLWSVE